MATIEESSPRRAALSAAFDVLPSRSQGRGIGAIPTSAEQWSRCLSDGEISTHLTAWALARDVLSSIPVDDDASLNSSLRPASIAFAEEVRRTWETLELLSTFDPGSLQIPQLAHEWQDLLLQDAYVVLEAAANKRQLPAAPTFPGQLHVGDGEDRDVLLHVFGIPAGELVDENGSFCDTRVIAAYRLRLPQLQRACNPIMGVVAERPPSIFTAVSAVRDLATSTSPLITLWAAREIRSRILTAFDADPDRARAVLSDAAKNGDKEWESFRRMQSCLRRAEAAQTSPGGTDAEYAVAVLEAYRHMAEGITRRWVGVLLRLSGLEEAPGLGAIAEPAVARLGELGSRIEAALIPAMRNAEAHDDFVFDEDMGLLVGDGVEFDAAEILARLTDLDVLQRGLIVGRLAAFADQPELAGEATGSLEDLSAGSALAFARQRFGHAGQRIRSFVRDRDRLEVVLDDLRWEACNPCFVALTQTAGLPALSAVSRYIIKIRDRDDPVIDLSAGVLQENWEVFEFAARNFPDGLPQATFLPCTTWCRMACESEEEVARAAAWLALNDAQHAINDADLSSREALRLRQRFEVVAAATSSAIRVLPQGSHLEPLRRAERVVRACANLRSDPYGTVFNRILGLRDQLGGPPAVLPTLDPRPLTGQGSYPHPTS